MEQESNNNHTSVAWFKLADLIARKEREKALSVFRLLSHSLQDRAYALQLEGDILWALEDRSAIERYKQAAYLYQREKRWIEAIAIYEHLVSIEKHDNALLATLIPCYAMVNWHEPFQESCTKLRKLFSEQRISEQQLIKYLLDIVTIVQDTDNVEQQQWAYEKIQSFLATMPSNIQQAVRL